MPCVITALFVAAAFLGGCASAGRTGAPGTGTGVNPAVGLRPATTTTSPPSLPVIPVEWAPCGSLQCGSVTVPLDYEHPEGPTLLIAVARHPAEVPAERIGSLVINPGGPGGSGIDDLPN